MSEGLNRVTLLGNLGADPELRVIAGGQAVLKMRLATTETYLDKSNTRQERTEWHSVTLWGKRGEALSKILAKGERILVEGRIETSSYEKDGEKRYRTEIIATNVILNGRGGDPGAAPSVLPRSRTSAPSPRALAAGADDFGDFGGGGDDTPF